MGAGGMETLQKTLGKLETAVHERQKHRDPPPPPQVELVGLEGLVGELEALRGSLESLADVSAHPAGVATSQHQPTKVPKPSPPPVPTTPVPKRHYVMNLGAVKCLDLSLSYKNSGVKIYSCNNGPAQAFWISAEKELRHAAGCADGSAANANIRLTKCSGKAEQQWELVEESESTGPGGTRLRNAVSKQCLDIEDDWAMVRPCSDACLQRWLPSLITGHAAPVHLASLPQRAPTKTHGLRMLCWILTQPKAHSTMVRAINNTWGRECDILLFVSSVDYPGVNMLVADTGQPESRKILWLKTQLAWMYVYEHYMDKADWFWKADDDTYALMPFLREYAATLDTNVAAHYGRRLQYGGQNGAEQTFVSGGSGMLLSRAAVQRMGERLVEDPAVWAGPINGPADLLTSRTLFKVQVPVLDTRDTGGRHRFITIGLEAEHTLFRQKTPDMWLFRYSNDTRDGHDCCSLRWVATHYVKEPQMYALYNMQQLQCRPSTVVFPYLTEQP